MRTLLENQLFELPKVTRASENGKPNGRLGGSGNTTERDSWQTPPDLFNTLNNQYNFKIDCCATRENAKTEVFTSDFLGTSRIDLLLGSAWMNPPFSRAREMFKHWFENIESGVAIYRCDNLESQVWQDVILPNSTWTYFLKGRVNYIDSSGTKTNGARFPSALIGYKVMPPIGVEGVLMSRDCSAWCFCS